MEIRYSPRVIEREHGDARVAERLGPRGPENGLGGVGDELVGDDELDQTRWDHADTVPGTGVARLRAGRRPRTSVTVSPRYATSTSASRTLVHLVLRTTS